MRTGYDENKFKNAEKITDPKGELMKAVLGKSGKGKECVFGTVGDDEYTQFNEFCEKHHYDYSVNYKSSDSVAVSTEKQTWKEFNSIKRKFLYKLSKKSRTPI